MPRAQSYNFHARLRGCFRATAASGAGANDADLEKAIKKAEFVKSEVEALIFLKKYRQSKFSHPLGSTGCSSCLWCRPPAARRSSGSLKLLCSMDPKYGSKATAADYTSSILCTFPFCSAGTVRCRFPTARMRIYATLYAELSLLRCKANVAEYGRVIVPKHSSY